MKQLIFLEGGNYRIYNKYARSENNGAPIGATSPIWVFWWQGRAQMPGIVSICFKSLLEYAGKHRVMLLTQENFRDYVQMPDYILTKLQNQQISITHFSDILRIYLLNRYGGIWVDSTILFTRNLDDIVPVDMPFYTLRHIAHSCNVVRGKWTSFFFACGKGNILPVLMQNLLFSYWSRHSKIGNYLLFDYLFALAYDHIPAIAKMIDRIPVKEMSPLFYYMEKPYDRHLAQKFCDDYGFHKLTYKIKLKEMTADGQDTMYGHLMTYGKII